MMNITPEIMERTNKNRNFLKKIREENKKPCIYFLKINKNTHLAELYEIIAEWLVPVPENSNFEELYKIYKDQNLPLDRLFAIVIPKKYAKEYGKFPQNVFFPMDIGSISNNSFFCIGFSKEEVFHTLRKNFQGRIENINKKIEQFRQSKENFLGYLSVLDRKEYSDD